MNRAAVLYIVAIDGVHNFHSIVNTKQMNLPLVSRFSAMPGKESCEPNAKGTTHQNVRKKKRKRHIFACGYRKKDNTLNAVKQVDCRMDLVGSFFFFSVG